MNAPQSIPASGRVLVSPPFQIDVYGAEGRNRAALTETRVALIMDTTDTDKTRTISARAVLRATALRIGKGEPIGTQIDGPCWRWEIPSHLRGQAIGHACVPVTQALIDELFDQRRANYLIPLNRCLMQLIVEGNAADFWSHLDVVAETDAKTYETLCRNFETPEHREDRPKWFERMQRAAVTFTAAIEQSS